MDGHICFGKYQHYPNIFPHGEKQNGGCYTLRDRGQFHLESLLFNIYVYMYNSFSYFTIIIIILGEPIHQGHHPSRHHSIQDV